jgi:hypothetical protein
MSWPIGLRPCSPRVILARCMVATSCPRVIDPNCKHRAISLCSLSPCLQFSMAEQPSGASPLPLHHRCCCCFTATAPASPLLLLRRCRCSCAAATTAAPLPLLLCCSSSPVPRGQATSAGRGPSRTAPRVRKQALALHRPSSLPPVSRRPARVCHFPALACSLYRR